jgi:hypothetical protein
LGFPPPEIVHRADGHLMLHSWCRCGVEATSCQLIVVPLRDGRVELNFHGTAEHSITLTVSQQQALISILQATDDLEPVVGTVHSRRA